MKSGNSDSKYNFIISKIKNQTKKDPLAFHEIKCTYRRPQIKRFIKYRGVLIQNTISKFY